MGLLQHPLRYWLALPITVGSLLTAQATPQPLGKLYCISPTSNHTITTLSSLNPSPACFRVHNGIFTQTLSSILHPHSHPARIPVPPPDEEEITYLDGHVLPGIIESHGHILQYGEMLESVLLYDAKSMEEVRERIKVFLREHVGEGWGTRGKWVRGIGWDQKFFGGVMPMAEELSQDPELKDLYIMLDRVDVHCVLVSQPILCLLSSPLPTPPAGGTIITTPGPGVFCDNAMDALIFPLAPKPTIAQKNRWFQSAMHSLNKVGIIGVGDAGMRAKDVEILSEMAERGEMTVRVNVMLECEERNTFCPEETQGLKLLGSREDGLGENMLMLGGVKLFADGALGSWGAALLEPYSDKDETSGTMLINETELSSVVKQWFDAGFQVNVHAIGDRANRAAIDAFETVLGKDCQGCNSARRLRIEHAQIIHPDDQKRMARMGIIPSIQPTHATSDMSYALSRLGPDRLKHSAYRMSSLFPSSPPPSSHRPQAYPGPVLGSDFPVEPPHPFHGMYAAVTRLNPSTGLSPNGKEGWYTEEALSVEQALRGFTVNGAYGWFREESVGKIEVGKWADWVVVDRDVLGMGDGMGLRDVEVRNTWVGGRKVWDWRGEEHVGGVKEKEKEEVYVGKDEL